MADVITYLDGDGRRKFFTPAPGVSAEDVAADVVPDGVEYEVKDHAAIPAADFEEPAADALARERETMTASAMQVRLALLAAGRLADVEALVANSTVQVQIAWDKATEFRRLSQMITDLAPSLTPPMTDNDLDGLFRAARLIEV